jgi:endonuclease/exonuclease/phosphatase family metal-dependent hydrolase
MQQTMTALGVRVALALTALVTLAGSAAAQSEIVLQAASAPARAGKWVIATDTSASGGLLIRHPDAGAAKVTSAAASPANYFELTFNAAAGKAYRLWIRGRADRDYWGNDSVFVQFSNSVTSTGSATYRIGTTSATEVNMEDCSGCGLSGWRWQDNGWGSGVLGPKIYFATTGAQKLRVQTREDGLAVDQIVLSAVNYVSAAPSGILSTTTTTTTTTAPEPAPTATTTTGTLLKVLDWNIHHGVGTDGVCDLNRFAYWIAKSGANVVSLNEVEKFSGWCGNADEVAKLVSLVQTKTGRAWYWNFAQRYGQTNGQGNLLLSTFPLESSSDYLLSYDRSVARIAIVVNGIRVNVFSTHLDADSSSRRATQMKQLTGWASTYTEQRILAGDFNAWPGATEIANMTGLYYDSWAKAKSAGTAVAYSGNEAGNTRNSRIDYIWFSKTASRLVLKEARVFDTRDANGVMPSDHRPLMATYEVK